MKLKARLVFFAITSIILLALFFSMPLWFSDFIQYFSERQIKLDLFKSVIQTINGIIALVSSAFTVYTAFIFFNQPSKTVNTELFSETSLENLRKCRLGKKNSQIPWVNREEIKSVDLDKNNHIVITGRMKIGKTRAAIELIQRVLDDELTPLKIFDISTSLKGYTPDTAREFIHRKFDRSTPVLFYIENLPIQYSDKGLDVLSEVVNTLKDRYKYYLIFTARSDQLKNDHQDWLEKFEFEKIIIERLKETQILELCNKTAKAFGLELDDLARDEFVKYSDGTPSQLIIGLLRLYNKGISFVDQTIAHEIASRSLLESWRKIRGEFRAIEPNSAYVINALATFYSSGITPTEFLIKKYTQFLKTNKYKTISYFIPVRKYSSVISLLSKYDISIHDGVFYIPDVAVEELILNHFIACNNIEQFITTQQKLFHLSKNDKETTIIYGDLANAYYLLFSNYEKATYYTYLAASSSPKTAWIKSNLGVYYNMQGKTGLAIAEYQKAISIDPMDAKPHFNLGIIYGKQGQTEMAIAEYQTAISLDPMFANPHFNLGIIYGEQGQTEMEIAEYQTAISLDPNDAMPHFNLGIIYGKQGQTEMEIAEYQTAISLDPNDAMPHVNLGIIYGEQGQTEMEIAEYQTAISLDPMYAKPHVNLGIIYDEQGQTEMAIAEYQKAISLDPMYAKPHFNLGIIYDEQGQTEMAIAEYQKAISLDPNDAKPHVNLGIIYSEQGQTEMEIAEYQKAISIDPMYAKPHFNLGIIYGEQGQTEMAIAEYLTAIAIDPMDANPHVNLGIIYGEQGQTEMEIAEYQTAISLDPNDAMPHFNLGNVYGEQGQTEMEIAEYQKAISIDPMYAKPHFNLGIIYDEQGQTEMAIAEYQKAISLDPMYAKPHVNLGVIYGMQEQTELAIAELQIAISLNPNDAKPHFNLGNVYGKQGQTEMAIAEYQTAISLEPNNTSFYERFSTALYVIGMYVDSAKYCNLAIKINPDRPTLHIALARISQKLDDLQTFEKELFAARQLISQEKHYDIACLEAVAGNIDQSLKFLESALYEKPSLKKWAIEDPDLENLRNNKRFQTLIN